MADLYILVGIPGSGKSTVAKMLSQRIQNSVIVSSDEAREELFGDPSKQYDDEICIAILEHIGYDLTHLDQVELDRELRAVGNRLVFNRVDTKVKEYLSRGVSVIYDATNISQRTQSEILRRYKKFYTSAYVYYVKTSLEIALERNRKRDRVVPEDVIRRCYNRLHYPNDRLFSGVYVIENDKDPPL